jgi:hypothetical protein
MTDPAGAVVLDLWRQVRGLQASDGIPGPELISLVGEFLAGHGAPLPEPGTREAAPCTLPLLGNHVQVETLRRAVCRRPACGWHGPLRRMFPEASTGRQHHMARHRARLACACPHGCASPECDHTPGCPRGPAPGPLTA